MNPDKFMERLILYILPRKLILYYTYSFVNTATAHHVQVAAQETINVVKSQLFSCIFIALKDFRKRACYKESKYEKLPSFVLALVLPHSWDQAGLVLDSKDPWAGWIAPPEEILAFNFRVVT